MNGHPHIQRRRRRKADRKPERVALSGLFVGLAILIGGGAIAYAMGEGVAVGVYLLGVAVTIRLIGKMWRVS